MRQVGIEVVAGLWETAGPDGRCGDQKAMWTQLVELGARPEYGATHESRFAVQTRAGKP